MKAWALCGLIIASNIWAQSPFYNKEPLGFLWGNLPNEEALEESQIALSEPVAPKQPSYTEIMETRQKQGKEILSKMQVLKTPEAAQEWMQWEQGVWEEAEQLGKLTEYVKHYRNPEMNYDLQHPTNHLGHQMYRAKEKQVLEQTLSDFAKSHGLLFFFSSLCGHCEVMWPVLKRVADKYHMEILGVSLDGGTIAGLDNSRQDQGLALKLMGDKILTPAVFALNPETGDMYPIVYGAAPEQQLEEHIMAAVEYAKVYPEMTRRREKT